MRTRQDVIQKMLFEIHDICVKNDIQYFLTSRAMRHVLRNEPLSINMITADIVMPAGDFDRFIQAFNADPVADREIEWLGNNGNFPGLFLRYVDSTTIHFNATRASCEKCLGMYVTINVIRPYLGRIKQRIALAQEKVWKNKIFYDRVAKGGLHQIFSRRMEQNIRKHGQDEEAKRFYKALIKEYSKGDITEKAWLMKPNTLSIERFANKQFAKSVRMPYLDGEMMVPAYYTKNRINAVRRQEMVKAYSNGKGSFCDTEISYKDFDLSPYISDARNFKKKIRDLNMDMRPYKRARAKLFNILVVSYLRFYHGVNILPHMDEIEALYRRGAYDKLDKYLSVYVSNLRKYKNVYLSERINEIVYDVYKFKPSQLYDDMPELYKEGIKLYDSKGNYLKTLGENHE